jgi:alkylation response protein AidB-like acyl-CoA dehydrogenase
MNETKARLLLERSRTVSNDVLYRWAHDVDLNNRFPEESITALREIGLPGYFVPEEYSGYAGDFQTYWQLAAILGEGCASTALIWVMHCQQVLALAAHAPEVYSDVLSSVAKSGELMASVVSERNKGGDFFTAQAALIPDQEGFRMKRFAPIVSYGAQATFFLITVRTSEKSSPHDIQLVLATRQDGSITVEGEWHSMGMHGTQSIPMLFDVYVPPDRIMPAPFRRVALKSMVPVIHLGWAAVWFGVARGALCRFVQQLRSPQKAGRKNITSDLFLQRLSRLRMSLDLLEAFLKQTASQLDQYDQDSASFTTYESPTYIIWINNLKIAASELTFSLIHDLVTLGGMQLGYLQNDICGIERSFRDLRSAALMYSNDRLLETNGRLMIIERTSLPAIWNEESGA